MLRTSVAASWVARSDMAFDRVVCWCAGHRLLHRRARRCKGLRICEVRAARAIRRLRWLFHDQFDEAPRALASPVPRYGDPEVDTCCNAAASEAVAVDADALAAGLGAELGERFPRAPVHSGTVASQQTRCPAHGGGRAA